ncbi:MerR family transcriptional regulator [Alkalicoccus luteus]|uniref:MerR family transcriptional regulator n=1 Tax=Alkalicoccus luteus TaxID=1237094 RepID=A0A969PVY8_9BACI|nr:MerR family transcriptional regulator [Alkalicoccus luteus]NJP39376.1 MerR family transcriptional regulator [Alkalicoccus luteus]
MNENVSNNGLKVKDVSNLLQESPSVIRNWMRELKPYIPLKKDDNGYNLFDEEALAVMKQIKELHRDRNYSIKQIEHYFSTGGKDYIIVPDKSTEEILAEELRDIKERLKVQEEENKKRDEFTKQLLKRLDEQQEYIDKKLLERTEEPSKALEEGEKEEEKEKSPWWKFWQ